MAAQDIAMALQRAAAVLARRPDLGLNEDSPATARWHGGTRIVSSHANGTELLTDMPTALGGSGDQVSPGWLFRAGFASCAATGIAMAAFRQAITLKSLEVRASSRSDARGLLDMNDSNGERVSSAPRDVALQVRISAHGVTAERLRALVESCVLHSPMTCTVRDAVPVALHIDVDAD